MSVIKNYALGTNPFIGEPTWEFLYILDKLKILPLSYIHEPLTFDIITDLNTRYGHKDLTLLKARFKLLPVGIYCREPDA